MDQTKSAPIVVPVGTNDTLLWGMTTKERLRRIAAAQKRPFGAAGEDSALLVELSHVFDPAWLRIAAQAGPGHAVTREGIPIIAHVARGLDGMPHEYAEIAQEAGEVANDELRKKERPFLERLEPASVRAIERASYFGAYKGVTDLLTKYLWPEWALVLTRVAARLGISPNQVTLVGALLCVAATFLFAAGHYWWGMLVGLGFMVLDTVDGKLARCTITSSWWGNIFDHGIDLIHPPFWWYAWGAGLAAHGTPIGNDAFWTCFAAILGGYVLQRLVEGVFMRRYGMHVHVWRRFDSRFRLITARRNPNMVILFASMLIGRPDLGFYGVTIWTVLSLGVHIIQILQAEIVRARGGTIRSWLQ